MSARRFCVLAAVAGACWGVSAFASETFFNPILRDSADPWLIQHKGLYFHNRSGAFNGLYVERTPEIHTLATALRRGVFFPPSGQPYSQNVWAPELHYLDGKWYMYFAADDGNNANHRMYVLEGNSQDPLGTYEFKGKIAPPTDRWAIDGTILEHGGSRYFVWSGWQGMTNVRQDIYIARMSNPWTLETERVLISQPDFAWEKKTGGIVPQGINEAPQIISRDGKLFIIYSASLFADQEYCLGMLTFSGGDILNKNSWVKTTSPVFFRTGDVAGPGHPSFVKSPDATQDWMVYHAHNLVTHFDERRNVHAKPFTFSADGVPIFGSPVSPSVALNVPSGRAVVTYIPNSGFDRPDVRSSSSQGFALNTDELSGRGIYGVGDNRGRFFDPITGGDGAQIGFIQTVGDNAIFHNVGQILEAGTYSLSLGFAISSDQATIAQAGTAGFRLMLESVAIDGAGNLVESDKVVLGSRDVSSSDFVVSSFTFFTADAGVALASERLDSMLRVGVYSNLTNAVVWHAKLDMFDLDFVPTVAWQRDAGGNWSNQSNWSGGIPSGRNAPANFTGAITAPRTISLDSPRTVGSILFNNANAYTIAGANTLTLNSTGEASITVASGNHNILAPMTLATNTRVDVAANQTLQVGAMTAGATVVFRKIGDGALGANQIRVGELRVEAGRVQIAPNGGPAGVVHLRALTIDTASGAALDLNDNDLIVDYTGSSPYAQLLQHVLDGYRTEPDGTATGIVSSASQSQGGDTILVLLDNMLVGGALSNWMGIPIDATTIIGKYTYFGDVNLDGQVTGDDFALAVSNLGMTSGAHWIYGDVNFDGMITGDDITLIVANLGKGVGNPLGASVPEPGISWILGIAVALMARRRRSTRPG